MSSIAMKPITRPTTVSTQIKEQILNDFRITCTIATFKMEMFSTVS